MTSKIHNMFRQYLLAIVCTGLLLFAPPILGSDAIPEYFVPIETETYQQMNGSKATFVLLTASWCQWCRIFESEVLKEPRVQKALQSDYNTRYVDVDLHPQWQDIPDFAGLPTIAIFDKEGQLLLVRSGYRETEELLLLLSAMRIRIAESSMEPYAQPSINFLLDNAITVQEAAAQIEKIEYQYFIQINSNDGGFLSPTRNPFPQSLLLLQQWDHIAKASPRSKKWVTKTIESALHGSSPRLQGQTLREFDLSNNELVRLYKQGPAAGESWRKFVQNLPALDPYYGIQDPIDHGVFRYASGPGWYHPHFERLALDNMAWILLLEARGDTAAAAKIKDYVTATFKQNGLFVNSQRSEAIYYRLNAQERMQVNPPATDHTTTLKVQARAARIWKEHCKIIEGIPTDQWPNHTIETSSKKQKKAVGATADAVGELLIALAECSTQKASVTAAALIDLVANYWQRKGLPDNARLGPLAEGICLNVGPTAAVCKKALKSVANQPLDPKFPPPMLGLVAQVQSIPPK